MQYDDLVDRVRRALERGDVSPAQVERLLAVRERPARPGRPGVAEVLAAIGVLVAYIGVAILFTIQWAGTSGTVRTVTPLLFPATALAAAVLLDRAGRPRWESELAGLIGLVALALTFAAALEAFDPAEPSHFALAASVIATVVVLLLHRQLRNMRLTGWGLSASLVALTGSAAAIAGVHSDTGAAAVLAAQGAVAAAVTGLALDRSRDAAAAAARASVLLFYLAAIVGQAGDGYEHLSVWHLIISAAVAGAFVCSVVLEFDGLVWLGALGALVWLAMVGDLIGSSSGWAVALVLVGLGLVGLSLLVGALRKGRLAIG